MCGKTWGRGTSLVQANGVLTLDGEFHTAEQGMAIQLRLDVVRDAAHDQKVVGRGTQTCISLQAPTNGLISDIAGEIHTSDERLHGASMYGQTSMKDLRENLPV